MSTQNIRRGQKDAQHPYKAMRRSLFEDSRLSFEARGVLGYILVKPDDWCVQLGDLMKQGNIGRDQGRRIINELIDAGYIIREDIREKGQFKGYNYTVFEEPQPEPEKPATDKPETGKPATENPTLNKEEPSTKEEDTTKEEGSCAATQTPAPSPSKKKEKEKKPEHPNTKAIFDAYCAVVSEAEPGCKILYPATRVCAQELAAAGWEPEQVTKAFWLMKKDAFWKAKHLTLMSVQKQIAALLKGKSNASDSEFKDPSIYGGEIQFTTEIDLDTLSFNF